MKKNIIVHGLIAGVVVSVLMLSSIHFLSHKEGGMDLDTSMLVGYASMLLALSLVYVGIRNYRDTYNGGVISFGNAFKIGMLIVLIASTIYVAAWMIDYFFFIPDFMDRYTAQMLEELRDGGATASELDKQEKEMASMTQLYKNPIFTALFTYLEILPVGLVVTLVSALLLKKKKNRKKALSNGNSNS